MAKGIFIGNGTRLQDIDKFVWGKNNDYIQHIDNVDVDCKDKMSKPNGMCTCPKNTWLRGFEFPKNKKDKYLDEWQENHCNVLSGYFWDQCEAV